MKALRESVSLGSEFVKSNIEPIICVHGNPDADEVCHVTVIVDGKPRDITLKGSEINMPKEIRFINIRRALMSPEDRESRNNAVLEREQAAREEMLSGRSKSYIEKSGMSGMMLGRTFESYRFMTESQERALKLSENLVAYLEAEQLGGKFVKRGLIFVGSTGVGKTHLSEAIGNKLMTLKNPISYGYLSCINLSGKKNVIDWIKKFRVVCLDDLDKAACGGLPKAEYADQKNYGLLMEIFEEVDKIGAPLLISSTQCPIRSNDFAPGYDAAGLKDYAIGRFEKSFYQVFITGPNKRAEISDTEVAWWA